MSLVRSYENTCPLKKFINKINEEINVDDYIESNGLEKIRISRSELIKKVASMLNRNYNLRFICDTIKQQSCCSFLNYWLDNQKDLYVKSVSYDEKQSWTLIEEYWRYLRNDDYETSPCERENEEKVIDLKKKRIDLMIYCENRDYIKKMCETSIGQNYSNSCLALSQFIEHYYNKFYTENKCFEGRVMCEDYTSRISEHCNLYDISKTFPEYDYSRGQIIVKDNSRKAICECENAPVPQDSLRELHEAAPESMTETPLPSSRPWKNALYGGIPFLGFFFFLFFLYKNTSLGPFLRSFIIKEEENAHYIDQKNVQEYSESLSEYIDYNLENHQYNFSYQTIQN
ncbi:PIR Superfamily Protein [Plasmodium ovale curtisi]|uniref:PIR Superfamily Protein n=1 Tax=Plasmodium ovale curtisi TaxID=864141 RepID=A0A1A8WFZ1_PLAOA|nr:PIR Superfamily Protein [Plasmodium ovale curtisi]